MRRPAVWLLMLLLVADVWLISEVGRLVGDHGHHKDTRFWEVVAALGLLWAALMAVTVVLAVRVLAARTSTG